MTTKKLGIWRDWPRERDASDSVFPLPVGEGIDSLKEENGYYLVFGERFSDRDEAKRFFEEGAGELAGAEHQSQKEKEPDDKAGIAILLILGAIVITGAFYFLGTAIGIPGISHMVGVLGAFCGSAVLGFILKRN